uniref:Ig-like domain-containing protein n=1 Tax=Magallana gigas TaxID=29159 RepID=A0A8W8P403_MAGGI
MKSLVGDTVNLLWTAPFFPAIQYNVYHTYRENKTIFSISSNGVSYGGNNQSTKYTYLSRPYNSTNITFAIRDITLDDAGYYNGGTSSEDAGGGVVLIVSDKPSTPGTTGDFNVEVNNTITLTCSSQSTSAPDYYTKLVNLSYTWLVNKTKMDRETSDTLKFKVTKDLKYNNYSCTATDEGLESERSDPVQINPLYGPDILTITPELKLNVDDKLTVREGGTIGPFVCTADCNPLCNITWRVKTSDGLSDVRSEMGTLLPQAVQRDMRLFRCIADRGNKTLKQEFQLDVQYLDEPTLYKDSSPNSKPMWTVKENESLRVACFVDGNPTPTVRLIKGQDEIATNRSPSKWANYTATLCGDTDKYICEGSSSGFNSSSQTVKINITCKLRIDKSGPLQTNYSSTSGNNVKVALAIPVISNPPPQASDITWMGPTDHQLTSTVSQRDVVYKHWINTSVPINNHSNFGYYVMKYKNETIHNITINAQDRPQQPLNFMAYSYVSGYVNMTWTSGFNGGSEQFFILRMRDETDWKIIANLTDPGKGGTVHFEHGPLTPGQEILYCLESCNIINCSMQSVEMKVNVKDTSKASLTSTSEMVYAAIGVSTGVSILIVILVVVLVIFFRRKNEKNNISYNRNSTSGMYAAVDKSLPKENKLEATISTKYSTDKKEDESHHGTETYAVVDKSITKKGGESTTKTKLVKTKKSKEKNKGKKGSLEEKNVSPVGSRKTNDEGLIYIDVEFTNKPESSDTNQKPVIHGEEDRTEYTFVDFSKKAPPTPETHDKEGK